MTRRNSLNGIAWALVFVILDSAQAVYFGGILQRQDAFLLGGVVFGLSAAGCLAWVAVRSPEQLLRAVAAPRALIAFNISAAGTWIAYLFAIQIIQPSVAFTIFVGVIPLVTIVAARFAVPGAERSRNRMEAAGNALIAFGLVVLVAVTLAGLSGFVRGGLAAAVAGVALAAVAGTFVTAMLLIASWLNDAGVGLLAQFGLRYPLYVGVAFAGFSLCLDAKGPVDGGDLLVAVLAGLLLLAFPIYAAQKAISLTTPLTVGSIAATSPLVIFLMELVEGRVNYAPTIMAGLAVYFVGAVLGAVGGGLANRARQRAVGREGA